MAANNFEDILTPQVEMLHLSLKNEKTFDKGYFLLY